MNAGEDVEKRVPSYTVGRNANWYSLETVPVYRMQIGTVWRFLKKLGRELPYHPAISLLGIYTKETRIERDACIPRSSQHYLQ